MRKKKEEWAVIEEEDKVEVKPVVDGEIIETPIEEVIKPIPEFYVLKIGETLADVAKKFGVKEAELKKLNGEVIGTNQIRVR